MSSVRRAKRPPRRSRLRRRRPQDLLQSCFTAFRPTTTRRETLAPDSSGAARGQPTTSWPLPTTAAAYLRVRRSARLPGPGAVLLRPSGSHDRVVRQSRAAASDLRVAGGTMGGRRKTARASTGWQIVFTNFGPEAVAARAGAGAEPCSCRRAVVEKARLETVRRANYFRPSSRTRCSSTADSSASRGAAHLRGPRRRRLRPTGSPPAAPAGRVSCRHDDGRSRHKADRELKLSLVSEHDHNPPPAAVRHRGARTSPATASSTS